MKNTPKLIVVALSIYIFSTICMSGWYVLLHKHAEFNTSNVVRIVTSIGLLAAIIPTIVFTWIYYLVNHMTKKLLLTLLILVLFVFLMVAIYQITLVMIFYHLDDPKSFLQSFMEIF